MTTRQPSYTQLMILRCGGSIRTEIENAFPYTEQAHITIRFPRALLYFEDRKPLERLQRSLNGLRLPALHPGGRRVAGDRTQRGMFVDSLDADTPVSVTMKTEAGYLPVARAVLGSTVIDLLDRQAAKSFKLAVDQALYLSRETFPPDSVADIPMGYALGLPEMGLARDLA